MEWPAKDILISFEYLVFEKNGSSFIFSEMNWQFIVYEPLA